MVFFLFKLSFSHCLCQLAFCFFLAPLLCHLSRLADYLSFKFVEFSQLRVMFSIFSVSFPCDLRRLLVFSIFFFSPVNCTIDNCQVFYFLNFFPQSSHQIICILLAFPSYLSCFLFSQFLSSVISADYSCCIERHCCENCKCSSDLLWHLNFLSPDYFVFRILSLCEVFHIFKTHILGIMQKIIHAAPGRLNKG